MRLNLKCEGEASLICDAMLRWLHVEAVGLKKVKLKCCERNATARLFREQVCGATVGIGLT